MTDHERSEYIEKHLSIVRSMQAPSGLFTAAAEPGVSTGYDKAWLRDNFYSALCFEEVGEWEPVVRMWHALLDLFQKHEEKISWAVENRPYHTYQYIHARYHPETFEEFWEEWGNKQNDAVGCLLFKLGDLTKRGIPVIRNDDDVRIVQRLVEYLNAIEYWKDPDNGVWEEYEEVHASSIAACVAGLRATAEVFPSVRIPDGAIAHGEAALAELLPRESVTKFTDLALLSVVWPFDASTPEMHQAIIRNLEYHLTRDKGVIRYKNDRYYNYNSDGYSEEAEWTMGFSWLSIIYRHQGDHERADHWLSRAVATISEKGTIPELYFSHTTVPNENNPLTWAESLFVVAVARSARE
jgi:phosphorylase kinase alpha/beta subunit